MRRFPSGFLFVFLIVGAYYFLIATHFTAQLFGPEHSIPYDAIRQSLLRGDCQAQPDVVGHECFYFNGKPVTYFGPFPAFVRMGFAVFASHPPGTSSRASALLASLLSLAALTMLIQTALKTNKQASSSAKALLAITSLVGLAAGTPIMLLLCSTSVYHEAIIWGLAWGLFGLAVIWRFEGSVLHYLLVSISCGGALLSRTTFALPLFIVQGWLFLVFILTVRRERVMVAFAKLYAMILPLSAAIAFQLWYNLCRYGSIFRFAQYWDFREHNKIFSLKYVPSAFYNYFIAPPVLTSASPYLTLPAGPPFDPAIHPYGEWGTSLFYTSPFILLGALLGAALLAGPPKALFSNLSKKRALLLVTTLAFGAQAFLILCHFAISQRYGAEFMPFFVHLFAAFLAFGRHGKRRLATWLMPPLAVSSVLVTFLTVAGWHQLPDNWFVLNEQKEQLQRVLSLFFL